MTCKLRELDNYFNLILFFILRVEMDLKIIFLLEKEKNAVE